MLENSLQLGNGIYTTREIAEILRVPYAKVYKWITTYWDGELGKVYEQNYSWSVGNTKAVGFHTLIEFYVMIQFAVAGVKIREVLKAHKLLSKKFNTSFPFAIKNVINNITTDGNKIFFNFDGDIVTLDGSQQFNLELVKIFFKKLEFDNDMLASRFWPLGKDKKIVCDPHRKFGQPTIEGTSIQSEAIYKMFLSKEPVAFIASLYDVSPQKVKDAIEFHKRSLMIKSYKIYIDENLPGQLAAGLNELQKPLNKKEGVNIEVLSIKEIFGSGEQDEDWIPKVGAEKGIVITQDFRIQSQRHQRELYIDNGVGILFLNPPSSSGFAYWDMVKKLISEWEDIKKIIRKNKTPFAYRASARTKFEKML